MAVTIFDQKKWRLQFSIVFIRRYRFHFPVLPFPFPSTKKKFIKQKANHFHQNGS